MIQIHRISTDQPDPRVKWLDHQIRSKISRVAQIGNDKNKHLQNSKIEELILKDLTFICKLYILYVSYFCLVDVHLKQDTLRLILVETILEWKLALV